MSKTLALIVVTVAAAAFFIACGRASVPLPAPPEPRATVQAAPGVTGIGERWNRTVAEGKKEGTVAAYTNWRPATRLALTQSFKERYDINLEFSTFTSGADLLAKVQAEKRAGLYVADFFGMGVSPLLNNMRPEGVLGRIEPVLMLPEVLDPNAWFGGKLPFPDKDGLAMNMIAMVMHMVVHNTDIVKEGEITTYRDLLKPQYRGKITMHDPSVMGSGNAAMTNIGHYLWGEEKTVDFLRRLIKEQQVVIQRDYRLHLETVARGKYAIALAPTSDLIPEFIAMGAPIKMAVVEEDTIFTSTGGAFGLPTKFAHPSATTVFVNWLLGKEGQSIIAKTFGAPSRRLEVSTEGINPMFLPDPNKKYYDGDSEESLVAKAKWAAMNKKIMEEAAIK